MSRPIFNINDAKLDAWTQGTLYGSADVRIGPQVGARDLGIAFTEVQPGKSSCPFHNHHVEHEMFIVLEGEGTYRFGKDTYPIRGGDVLAAPAGGQETAHQIINTGKAVLRYYAISTMAATEVCEYPDSGKFGVFSRASGNPYDKSTIRHLQHLANAGVGYWDAEPGA